MPLVGILRHQRYHVYVEVARVEHEDLEGSLLAGAVGSQHNVIFLPGRGAHIDCGIGQQLRVLAPALRLHQCDAHLLAAAVVTEESGEVVLLAGLHRDAVEAVVLQSEASPALKVVELPGALCLQAHIRRVVGMDTVVLAHLHLSEGVPGAYHAPGSAGTPSVALGGIELEGAVLYQFGIESAVSSTADVLEEDADQFVTDGLAALRGSHWLLGVETHGGCR